MWSPTLSFDVAEGIGDDADLVLVGALGDDGAVVVEQFLEDDDLALDLVAGGLDDVEALVQDESWPGLRSVALMEGCRLTFTLRPCERMLTVPSSFAER